MVASMNYYRVHCQGVLVNNGKEKATVVQFVWGIGAGARAFMIPNSGFQVERVTLGNDKPTS